MKRKIKKSTIKLSIVELLLTILFVLNIFVLNIKNLYIISSFLMLMVLVVVLLLGYEKNKLRMRTDAIINNITITLAFQFLYYMSGLLFGFLKNVYSLDIINIIRNILPIIILIFSTEILRYCINQKGRDSRLVLILSCLAFFTIEASINYSYYNLSDGKDLIEYIFMILCPVLLKNILLTVNTTKFGYQSSIVYRIIMELPIYLIPIVPNYSKFISSILFIVFPVIVFLINERTLTTDNTYIEVNVRKKNNKIPLVITIVILSTIIALNSGLFKWYMLAVGSGSMEKEIYRGDSVLVEKLNDKEKQNLKVGDIIVYKYQNKIIVHRIYEINNKNKSLKITTKGDNNENPDNWVVKEDNIIGKVKFKIKYVGYPTVLINESFK